MVAAFAAAVTGLASCTPAGPIGLREPGNELVVVLGRQCTASTYLPKLRLNNVDENTNDSVLPPL